MNLSKELIVLTLALVSAVAFRSARGLSNVQTGGSGGVGPAQNCSDGTEVLSRRRRFLTPLLSGWIFYLRLTLVEPLLTPFGSTFTQLIIFLPILFRLDRILWVFSCFIENHQTCTTKKEFSIFQLIQIRNAICFKITISPLRVAALWLLHVILVPFIQIPCEWWQVRIYFILLFTPCPISFLTVQLIWGH